MANSKYTIIESVGSGHQTINEYQDIEKHHPTWKEDPKKRFYGEIDGKREEFVYSPDSHQMVSKDIILKIDGSSHVPVPSPVEGYVKRTDRWGMVEIYDQPNGKGQMIARVRHMEPVSVADGSYVAYGQPLGIQGGKNPNGKPFGIHAHIDIDVRYLDNFKQYIKDIDSGVITTDKYPAQNQPNPFANPDNFGALETPSLSPVAQTIKQQCHSHVHGFCERNNQPWTEGMDNTYMALTVVAREAQMSGVDALGVSQGTIYIAQTDRKGIYREAEINSLEAANIPLAQSEQRLAIIDQQMLAQEQQQAIDNLAQTQHKVHSGPRMG